MNAWVQHKARRLVFAGAVAFAVGAPTIACMGGDTAVSDDGDGDGDGDGDDDDDDGAQAKLQGDWRYFPVEEELRTLKVINAAISGKAKQLEKLKPLSSDEQAMYDDFKRRSKGDPEVAIVKEMIGSMKGATVTFDGDNFSLTNDGGKSESEYEITSESGNSATVVVEDGPTGERETHKLKFINDTKIEDEVSTSSGSVFNFELKKK